MLRSCAVRRRATKLTWLSLALLLATLVWFGPSELLFRWQLLWRWLRLGPRPAVGDGIRAIAGGVPTLCPPTAHYVWSFPVPLSCREVVAASALLAPSQESQGQHSFRRVHIHVAHEALLLNETGWKELRDDPRLVVIPLRLRTLFRDTPLADLASQLSPWKVVSGPDFPYQLDVAVRLAVAWRYGGHVFPADFLLSPAHRAPRRTRYLTLTESAPFHSDDVGNWPGGVGPLCAARYDPYVAALMSRLRDDVLSCMASGVQRPKLDPHACVVFQSLNLATFVSEDETVCPVRSVTLSEAHDSKPNGHGCYLEILSASTLLFGTQNQRRDAVIQLLEASSAGGVGARASAFASGAVFGAHTPHALVGQRPLASGSLLHELYSLIDSQKSLCRSAGSAWHQGCTAVPPTSRINLSPSSVHERVQQFVQAVPADATTSSFGIVAAPATENRGDDVQTLAAIAFLPFIGYIIDRDQWSRITPISGHLTRLHQPTDASMVAAGAPIFAIMNGWWERLESLLEGSAEERIQHLFVAFHMSPVNETFPKAAQVLAPHQPIGARDTHTVALLARYGIESYFTGCLTTTLENVWVHQRDTKRTLIVPKYNSDWFDLPRFMPDALRQTAEYVQIHVTNDWERPYTAMRLLRAWGMLHQYATARLVVTSALHGALPSIAFDTPTIFLHTEYLYVKDGRFKGLSELFPEVRAFNASADAVTDYDFYRPAPPTHYSTTSQLFARVRRGLRARVMASCLSIEMMALMAEAWVDDVWGDFEMMLGGE